MEFLFDPNIWLAFFMLAALEIVLGIDNVIFITVLVSKLPAEMQHRVRQFGLMFAMVSRVALLFSLSWIIGLTEPLFSLGDKAVSGRDLVLFFGGLFLLWKATREIYTEVEDTHAAHGVTVDGPGVARKTGSALFWGSIVQIGILDIVFSLDSVITAVGMVDEIGVMIAAVMAAVGVMLVAAKSIGEFVEKHASIKVLALSFLMMVGMALMAEGWGMHIPKGYLYAAMGFSLGVELLNIRARGTRQRKRNQVAAPAKT
jgi:predicted tellurium resistance membrane protein TerC